jgi:eukaryotic translation initiation factor 2C
VALAEISSVKRALASLENIKESEVLTPITYIAVQKRHHVKMFPMPNEGDRNGNVLPGTVVDTEITHPNEFNFYMCSHGSLLGTARPTHYYVLVDENGMSSDTVQKLTYEMCYLFCRATRAVSICPPVYYADILAYRARYHTSMEWEESISGERASSVISETSFAKVVPQLEDVMYFV